MRLLVAREAAEQRVPHVPVRLNQARQHDHVIGDDDLYARCADLSAHGNYFAVSHMHGPAWDIAQRRVHGHEMRVTNDKFSPWPDIGGRTPYAFRILCTLRKEG